MGVKLTLRLEDWLALAVVKAAVELGVPSEQYVLDVVKSSLFGRCALPPQEVPKSARRRTAKQLLLEVLAASPVPGTEVIAVAAKRGISERTLRRAAKDIGVVSKECREPNGRRRYYWSLPPKECAEKGGADR